MSARTTPGRVCDLCEGFCLQPVDARVDMSFRIGQRVRHQDYKGQRVTGVVTSLSVDSERGLMVCIALDAPIVIPAGHGHRAINIYTQHAQAHEFSTFDERDALVAELLSACRASREVIAMERQSFADCNNVPGLTAGDDPDNYVTVAGVLFEKHDAHVVADYDRTLAQIDAAIARANGAHP